MSYATRQDLVDRFGEPEIVQLTDRNGDGNEDAGVLDQVLADADDEINAYLGERYTLPLASVPTLLVRIACDIARYRLWDDDSSEEVRRRYDDALKSLKMIAKGEIGLGVASLGAPASSELGGGEILSSSNPERIFGRGRY